MTDSDTQKAGRASATPDEAGSRETVSNVTREPTRGRATFFIDSPDPVWKANELYSPLNAAKREVRFLQLRPSRDGTWKDLIECIMITSTLDVEYHAVSYVWGSPHDPVEILVNGHGVNITRNLHQLLTRFRTNAAVWQSLLWIDALCINQQDVKEREEQVQIMGDIYTAASLVQIYMGHSTEHMQSLGQTIHSISDRQDRDAAFAAIVDNDVLWEEFCRLTHNDWFTRVWVIQEAVKARARIVWCGSVLFDLDDILEMVSALGQAIYRNGDGIRRRLDSGEIWTLVSRLLKFNPFQGCYRTGDIKNAMGVFLLAQTSKCSDQRDHVYGLLSLLPQAFRCPVNYRISAAKVYARCTFQMMVGSQSLEPLRLRQPLEVDKNVPSWVPDYQKVYPYTNFDQGPGSYQADGNAIFFAEYSPPHQLKVRVLEVDTVQVFQVFPLSVNHPEPPPEHPDYDEENYMREVFKGWRRTAVKFATHDIQRDELTMEIALWQAIAGDKLPGNHPQSNDSSEQDYKYVDGEMALGLRKWLFADKHTPEAKLNSKLRSLLSPRTARNRWFVTKEGRMGSVYGECKVGDIVAILAGLSRPVLLRAIEGEEAGKRRFVCACYCDGLMHGEAVRQAARPETGSGDRVDSVFTEIILV